MSPCRSCDWLWRLRNGGAASANPAHLYLQSSLLWIRNTTLQPHRCKMTPKGHLTYRLQGIPISYTRGDIHSRLCHFLRLHGQEIQIFSLAQDPFSGSRQVATLALPSLPDRFRTPSKPDTWLLRNFWRNDQNANESASPDATIDIDFYGLTPLHTSPDQNCDTEYACLYFTHT